MSQQIKSEVRNWNDVMALLDNGRLVIRAAEEAQSPWEKCNHSRDGEWAWPLCKMHALLDGERVAEWECWQVVGYKYETWNVVEPGWQWTVESHDGVCDGISRSGDSGEDIVFALSEALFPGDDEGPDDDLTDKLHDLCRDALPTVLPPDADVDELWEQANELCQHAGIVKEWGKVWIVWKDADGERHSYRRDDKGDIPDDDDLEGLGRAVVCSEGCDLCGHYDGIGQAYLDSVDDFDELPDHAFDAEEGRNRPNVHAVGRAAVDGEISEGGTSIPVSVFVEIGRAAVREHAGFTNEDD